MAAMSGEIKGAYRALGKGVRFSLKLEGHERGNLSIPKRKRIACERC